MSVKLQTKALYNLLRFNYIEDPKLSVQKWQVEDLRTFTTDDLFKNLKKFKIILNIDDFKSLAFNFDSPESFAMKITEKFEKVAEKDKIFLLIFELWRRLLPDRQTFSVFCDELDNMILQYDQNILDNDEQIQDFLAILQEILETNVDTGLSIREVYDFFISYLAHNFEAFLFDYIHLCIFTVYFTMYHSLARVERSSPQNVQIHDQEGGIGRMLSFASARQYCLHPAGLVPWAAEHFAKHLAYTFCWSGRRTSCGSNGGHLEEPSPSLKLHVSVQRFTIKKMRIVTAVSNTR